MCSKYTKFPQISAPSTNLSRISCERTSSPSLFSSWTVNARFTLADPTPRLASDVVGGKSGQNLPTSCRDPIHIGQMSHNAYIRVGWYGERTVKESYLLQLLLKESCIVHVRLPIGRRRRAILNMFNIARRPPDGLLMRPRQPIPGQEPIHIGRADSIGASDRLTRSGHKSNISCSLHL